VTSHTEAQVSHDPAAGPPREDPEREDPSPAVPVVAGYAIVLPPGWRKIPVRQGSREAIRRILDEVLGRVSKSVPREKLVRPRIQVERRLTAMADQARRNAGIDIYLPIEYIHGSTVPASFVVSEGSPGLLADGADPGELIAYLATETDASSLVTVDGAMGARTETVAAPDPEHEVPLGSRRVDYVLAVPECPGRWLMVTFSTLGDGDPEGQFAKILVDLFDAMMSTFRWSWA
jgi:hypothetical protein